MTGNELELFHKTSLRILEEIGVKFEHAEIVARLKKAGARDGAHPNDLKLPGKMVREYLVLAPEKVSLTARNGTDTVLKPDSSSVFWTNPAMHFWTGKDRREITSADLTDIARLCDGLENVQGIMGVAMKDVAPAHRDFTGLRVIAENSRKHIRVLCFTPRGAEALIQMKPVFSGNWFSIGFTAHGPLRWTNLALDIFLKSSGHGIPVTINGEPMAGVTGPVTHAGAAAVGNAEILAGIVVNQVLEPGRPVIYNLGLAHVFDMKAGTAVTGGPENPFYAELSAGLGQFYKIPSSSWVSTEAVFEDEQAGFEKMFAIHTHMLAGVSLIWGLGQLESEMTTSLGQLVMDNEMIAYARHYQRGFKITAEELQFDLIRETGIGGNYLDKDHTLENFRRTLFDPAILNRKPRASSAGTLPEVALEKAKEIIKGDTSEKIKSAELQELKLIENHFRK